jgi:hypothetical protein
MRDWLASLIEDKAGTVRIRIFFNAFCRYNPNELYVTITLREIWQTLVDEIAKFVAILI